MSETRPIESSANAKKFLDQLAQTDALSAGTQTSLRNAISAPPAAGVVRHDAAQSLTSDQKTQAAANLGATSSATVNTLVLRGSEGEASFAATNGVAMTATASVSGVGAVITGADSGGAVISSNLGVGAIITSVDNVGASIESTNDAHLSVGDGKVIVANNGDTTFTGKVISPNLVRHDAAQSLTLGEKAQARTNIEATTVIILDYAPLNAPETGLVIPDVELQTAISNPFYLDTPYFLPQVGDDYYGDDQWEVYPQDGNWIFHYTTHDAVWTGAPAANAVDSALAVGDGVDSFGDFQPQMVTRPKTTGAFATFNGRLYANHGTDDLPDWQEVVVPVEISNFVTRTGASQMVSSPKVFSGANLHSGPNIFTQPVTATNPATAASHLLDRATADARLGSVVKARLSAMSISLQTTPQTIHQLTLAPGVYFVKMLWDLAGTANTGTKHGFECVGGAATVRFFRFRSNALNTNQIADTSYHLGLAEVATTAWIEGTIEVTAQTILHMQAAQNTSHADNLSVTASSYLHVTPSVAGSIS